MGNKRFIYKYTHRYYYMAQIKLIELRCKKCEHKWKPRQEEVRICPKCKSAWWDTNGESGTQKDKKTDL